MKKKDFSRLPFSNIRCVSPFHIVFYLWQPPVPPHIPPSANVHDLWSSLHWCSQCLSFASSCHHHKSGVRITFIIDIILDTGCPTIEFSLCFACFLGFPCSYRGSFYHFSTAQETTIPKLTLLSSLYQKLIKLQSKTWSNLDLDTI